MAEEIKGNTQPPAAKDGEPQRTTAVLARKAVEFITANKGRPFLLQVSHAAVHIPLSTTPELKAKYVRKKHTPGYPSYPEYAGLQGVCFLREAPERAIESDRRAGKEVIRDCF